MYQQTQKHNKYWKNMFIVFNRFTTLHTHKHHEHRNKMNQKCIA